MKILVINAGSSSMKYQLIDMENENVIAKGNCERIGIDGFNEYKAHGNKFKRDVTLPTHKEAIEDILKVLTDDKIGVIRSTDEIDAVGHRIVQGAEVFNKSEIVTEEVIKKISDLTPLAPLHQPGHVAGIRGCIAAMPNTPQVVVFDTVFHTSSMPDYAYRYAVPEQAYKDWGIRKYGFHGTSHKYVNSEIEKILGKGKYIICHIGSGASVSAVKDGRCQDTSMGFTPLEGLIMGTRTGDIDPTVLQRIMTKTGKNIDEMINYLNKECGLLALSGGKSDVRDVEAGYMAGDEKCILALKAYTYRIKKYIGSYMAVLNGADAIAFTAGVGENGPFEREMICEGLENLGIVIDKEKNMNAPRGEFSDITGKGSKVKLFVIPTNEEIMIARETQELIGKKV